MAIKHGGRELNPLLRWFLLRWGFAGLAGAKLAITGACVWFALAAGYPLALLPLIALTGWIAWRNSKVLRQIRGGK